MAKKKKEPKITVRDTTGGRFYVIDEKEYVSVTTPLSIVSVNFLEVWRAKVGKKAADAIGAKAAAKGTKMHSYADAICMGEEPEVEEKHQKQVDAFKEWFTKNVKRVVATEKVVWSDRYGVAGRFDFLGEVEGYDGLTVIDWKTGRVKKEHFMQMSAYRYLIHESLGVPLEDIKNRLIVQLKDDKVKAIPRNKKQTEDVHINKDFDAYINLLNFYKWCKEE